MFNTLKLILEAVLDSSTMHLHHLLVSNLQNLHEILTPG